MEPMALGSAPSSPSSPMANPNFLPSFLMGSSQPSTPHHNIATTPERTKSTPFAIGTDGGSLRQRIFSPNMYEHEAPSPTLDVSIDKPGPPKQGLFDTIDHRPTFKKSFGGASLQESFNADVPNTSSQFRSDSFETTTDNPNLWVTIFGFPSSSASLILARFANCGTIVEKRFPSQGNWVHLKFSTPQETARALALNGKVICNNLMVGVVPLHTKQSNKENAEISFSSPMRVRPLRQSFTSPQNANSILPPQNVPQKSTGLVTKAMEYVFGW